MSSKIDQVRELMQRDPEICFETLLTKTGLNRDVCTTYFYRVRKELAEKEEGVSTVKEKITVPKDRNWAKEITERAKARDAQEETEAQSPYQEMLDRLLQEIATREDISDLSNSEIVSLLIILDRKL